MKSRLTRPNWVHELPWVLLSTRTTPKGELKSSSVELVYDEPLTVPDNLVTTNTAPWTPQDHINILLQNLVNLL